MIEKYIIIKCTHCASKMFLLKSYVELLGALKCMACHNTIYNNYFNDKRALILDGVNLTEKKDEIKK